MPLLQANQFDGSGLVVHIGQSAHGHCSLRIGSIKVLVLLGSQSCRDVQVSRSVTHLTDKKRPTRSIRTTAFESCHIQWSNQKLLKRTKWQLYVHCTLPVITTPARFLKLLSVSASLWRYCHLTYIVSTSCLGSKSWKLISCL